LTDTGERPFPLASSFHWWTSPDIWIEPYGHIVANEDNFINVRIFNQGMADAIPVLVDFYWASPAISLSNATVNHIGNETVTVSALSSQEVRCSTPHRPISSVPIFTQTLIVNCNNPILDPITHPFQPMLDRHVGPYSLALIPEAPTKTIELALNIYNPFPFKANIDIFAWIEHVFVTEAGRQLNDTDLINQVVAYGTGAAFADPAMVQQTHARQACQGGLRDLAMWSKPQPRYVQGLQEAAATRRSAPAIRSQLSETSSIVTPVHKNQSLTSSFAAMNTQQLPSAIHSLARANRLLACTLRPFEQRRIELELTVPANAKQGEYIVMHLTQRTEEVLTGGYCVVARVTDQRSHVKCAE
jgi:hypothetical protein